MYQTVPEGCLLLHIAPAQSWRSTDDRINQHEHQQQVTHTPLTYSKKTLLPSSQHLYQQLRATDCDLTFIHALPTGGRGLAEA